MHEKRGYVIHVYEYTLHTFYLWTYSIDMYSIGNIPELIHHSSKKKKKKNTVGLCFCVCVYVCVCVCVCVCCVCMCACVFNKCMIGYLLRNPNIPWIRLTVHTYSVIADLVSCIHYLQLVRITKMTVST